MPRRGGNTPKSIDLPHQGAALLTDLTGNRPRPLDGGPDYRFPVKPQEIITMRLRAAKPVPESSR